MKSDGPDSFHSFIVAAACCLIFCLMNGTIRISGLLLVSIMSVFNIGREQASFPFVFNVTMRYLAGPLAGLLARMIGIRPIVVFGCCLGCVGVGSGFFAKSTLEITIYWGVLYGIGRGLATSVLIQVVNLYFIKHASKMYGLVFAGESLSGFVLPPIVERLLQFYGLPGTFLILTGILLNCFALAILTKEPNFEIQPSQRSDKNVFDIKPSSLGKSSNICSDAKNTQIFALECEQNESYSKFSDRKTKKEISIPEENKTSCFNDLSIFWDPLYISVCICVGFTNVFLAITPTIIVDYAIDKGISITDSTYLIMAYSIVYIISSIVIGWIMDHDWLPRSYFSALYFLISAGSYILLPMSKSFPMVMLAVILDGMSVGAMFPIYPGFVTDYIVKEKQTVAMTSLGFLFVPLSFTISPLIGYSRDHIGSYDYLLYLMCTTSIFCCVLSLCIPRIAKCRKTNSRDI